MELPLAHARADAVFVEHVGALEGDQCLQTRVAMSCHHVHGSRRRGKNHLSLAFGVRVRVRVGVRIGVRVRWSA